MLRADVSLIGTALWMVGSDVLAQMQGAYRQSPPLGIPRTSLINPLAASYRCADGRWLMICCLQGDKYWRDVCHLLDRSDLLGEHADAVLESLGYSWDDIVALKMNGAIL